jgi:phosphate ABC transporter phosphate-binding protein
MDTAPRYLFLVVLVLVVGAIIAIALYAPHQQAPPKPVLHGAGSTFVDPLMIRWSHEYESKEDGCKLDYAAVGSGGGIKQLMKKNAAFACTDGPLTDEQMQKGREAGSEFVHVPLVMGAVVPAYNLPEAAQPLRFTGRVLADIYLGAIKKWNDPRIKSLNARVADRLPDRDIVVVHRADGSGTTYIWTDYLSKVSAEWKKAGGTGVEVTWPTGVAEEGNEGVAEHVKRTPGSTATSS